ncbi:NACHT N-terminal helical domain 7-containing protein [Rugosimonospora acidiphila]|uniref:NACHT N-terminal helical domain 7-containing protein n=1 Tax=Rugosimonospora acidiphila TaxID=556531 RepID=UPI003CD05747
MRPRAAIQVAQVCRVQAVGSAAQDARQPADVRPRQVGPDAATQQGLRSGGLRRHQLVTAAHLIIVMAAFFDASLHEYSGGGQGRLSCRARQRGPA